MIQIQCNEDCSSCTGPTLFWVPANQKFWCWGDNTSRNLYVGPISGTTIPTILNVCDINCEAAAGASTCSDCPAGKTAPAGSDALADCIDVAAPAPTDTPFVVSITVTLPYTEADFNEAKRNGYRTAVASAAGVNVVDVIIVSIKAARRRTAGSIKVETEIRAADAAASDKISSTLGSGDAMKTKLTKALQAQGLAAPTAVSDPVQKEKNGSGNLGTIIGGTVGGAVVLCCCIAAAVAYACKAKPVAGQQSTAMPTDVPVVTVARSQPLQTQQEELQSTPAPIPSAQAPDPTQASMVFCENCGNRVRLGKFCQKCGTKASLGP